MHEKKKNWDVDDVITDIVETYEYKIGETYYHIQTTYIKQLRVEIKKERKAAVCNRFRFHI